MMVHTEFLITLVDIRTQCGNSHLLTLVHQFGDFRDLVTTTAHNGSHELCGIVGFEVGRLVSHPRIAGGMRLIESVGGELLPVSPDLLKDLRIMAILLSTLNELGLHRINNILLLLTHRLTEGITLTSCEVSQLTRQQHHLLLINGNAIGILQVFLHARDIILDLLTAILTGDERGNIIHRAWTIEGIHGNQILEHRGMELTQILLHTSRLELERSDGLSLLIEFVCLGVIDRNRIQVYVNASRTFDIRTSLLQLGKRLQTQEVHLDKTR